MKKNIFKVFVGIVIAIVFGINLFIVVTGKFWLYNALYYNFPSTKDMSIFDNRQNPPAIKPLSWKQKDIGFIFSDTLQKKLIELETHAVVVVVDSHIIYEKYGEGHDKKTLTGSFSMAKSFVSFLIGCAIKEGKIKSVKDPVGDYLPSFARDNKKDITIEHCLMMSSGLSWDEAYAHPLSITTEAYYGKDLKKLIDKLTVIEEPGTVYRYKGSDTQVLSFVLEQVTGKTLSQYAYEKIWNPIGTESSTYWSLDRKDGFEKASCCISATARDYAKCGQLFLQQGFIGEEQLIDSNFFSMSIIPNRLPNKDGDMTPVEFYGYQWWLIPDENVFYARGILGQYIIMLPDCNAVIVRLGEKRGKKIGHHYEEALLLIKETKAFLEKRK